MTAPKRDARALLAAGGLLLTLLTAGGAAPSGVPDTPRAARVAAGAATQGDFTLLAVTRGGPRLLSQAVPPTVPAPPGPPPPFQIVTASADATGLWIGVRGGIGFETLQVPNDHLRHVYPLGSAAMVVDETSTSGTGFGWTGPDGVSRVAEGVSSYGFQASWAAASPGHPAGPLVTLIPCRLADRFSVTAQPLDAAGRALGRPVRLLCQSVTPQVMFAQFPAAYSARTRQFRVTAARVGAKTTGATWRMDGLPPAVQNGPDGLPPAVTAAVGSLTIRAAAAETEDFSGFPDWWNRHPPRWAGDGWAFSQPLNADGHQWTGVPSIRFLLAARNAGRYVRGQSWVLKIDRVTPQWTNAPVPPSTAAGTPLDAFPLYEFEDGPSRLAWMTHDWQIGAAYPGQQHWVAIDGTALRSVWREETLTFHDADVVHDAAFGGDRIVWEHPETKTTPSGVSVTALNGRPGVSDVGAGFPGGPVWRFDGGSAEMLLAWRVPPGIASEEHAALDAAREAEFPKTMGTLASEWNWSQPLLWDRLTLPGGPDAGALRRAGYSPLLLSVRSTVPPDLSRLPRREGVFGVPPTPLPTHLLTITFQIGLREEQERRPFHLLVPVRAAFPRGWDADAADSRSRQP